MSRDGKLPYPGLRAFKHDEADIFFGREALTDDMVDKLAATRFLAVLGSSGSGKSSIVRTGLFSALELGLNARLGADWLIVDSHPGSTPFVNLAEALTTAAGGAGDAADGAVDVLASSLRQSPRALEDWCEAGRLAPGRKLLVLIDQFEELFRFSTYARREEAEAFAQLLIESASSVAPIYIVTTMRSEYLGACSLIPGLAERINAGLYLTPRLTREQCREAIEGPARVCGFAIEPELVTRLLNDMAAFAPWEEDDKVDQLERISRRADQLPLMQHVLNRLWLQAASGGAAAVTLTLAQYERLGGLERALEAHGDEILARLGDGQRPMVAKVFRALVAGSGALAVRRPTSVADLVAIGGDDEAVKRVVNVFRAPDCNFLTLSSPRVAGETVVDLSHESLIRQWPFLRQCVDDEDQARRQWQRLSESADRHAENKGDLLDGLDLKAGSEWMAAEKPNHAWAKRYGNNFERVGAFLVASEAAHELEIRRKADRVRRDRDRTRLTIFLVSAAAVAAMVMGILATIANQKAQTGLRDYIAVQAWNGLDKGNPLLAARYAMAGATLLAPGDKPSEAQKRKLDVYRSILGGASFAAGPSLFSVSHDAAVEAVDLSQDGKYLVTGGDDWKAVIWRTNGAHVVDLPHEGNVTTVHFSPDSQRVLTVSKDKATLWSIGGKRISELTLGNEITAAKFSRDGSLIVTTGYNGAVRLWDGHSGQPVSDARNVNVDSSSYVSLLAVDISPDGKHFVTADDDNKIRLWNVSGGIPITLNVKNELGISPLSVSYSDDGHKLLALYSNNVVGLWDASNNRFIRMIGKPDELGSHEAKFSINNAVFYYNDTQILTSSNDGSIYAWDSKTGKFILKFGVNDSAVGIQSVYVHHFSEEDRVVAVNTDGSVSFWNGDGDYMTTSKAHEGQIKDVAFSFDGRHLATASSDKTVRYWDLQDKSPAFQYREGSETENLSPDGMVAIVSRNDADDAPFVEFHDLQNLKTIKTIKSVSALTRMPALFSADASKAVFLDRHKGFFTLWNTQNGEEITPGDVGEVGKGLGFRWGYVQSVVFSRDATRFAVMGFGDIDVYDARSGHGGKRIGGLAIIDNRAERFTSMVFSNDGKILYAATSKGAVTVWDVESKNKIHSYVLHSGRINGLDLYYNKNSNETFLLTVSDDKKARVWNTNGMTLIKSFSGHDSSISMGLFSPDGSKVITTSSDFTARLWSVREGTPIASLPIYPRTNFDRSTDFGATSTIGWSHNGKMALIFSSDDRLHIMSGDDGHLIATLPVPADKAVFTKDDKSLVVASSGNVIHHWDISALTSSWENLKANICGTVLSKTDNTFSELEVASDPVLKAQWGSPSRDVCTGVDLNATKPWWQAFNFSILIARLETWSGQTRHTGAKAA